jgi:PPOX class probable F420-dependent enzyme
MDIKEAIEFARENHRAVLATNRADGRPQMSPVVVGVDDEGNICVSTRKPAMKVRNLRRDPRASVCIVNDNFFGAWAQVDATVEIVELPAAMDLLISIYRQIAGEHPDWDEYKAAMEKEQRVVLRLRPEAAGPNRAG